jgi:hypothetical protein
MPDPPPLPLSALKRSDSQPVKALKRLLCAYHDFEAASAATELLISNREKWEDSIARRAIETGIVVTYARPFGENHGLGALPSEFRVIDDPDAQRVHERLLLARNALEAHNDMLERGGLIAGHVRGDDPLNVRITVLDDGHTFWDINTASLDLFQLRRLLRLLIIQQKRVEDAAHSALKKMFDQSPRAPGEYSLGVDFP